MKATRRSKMLVMLHFLNAQEHMRFAQNGRASKQATFTWLLASGISGRTSLLQGKRYGSLRQSLQQRRTRAWQRFFILARKVWQRLQRFAKRQLAFWCRFFA
ncbi:hypothetical protein NPIL_642541 [Nephila pilipes]|uniref:Uncharacterized protein n=1 Tax=Nephila pilipes TaxID=299642 RepID=A0A8X6P2P7_NEPPI|nr:hypothetical protein NPIL_642541 [Nephila pilipes]